MKIGKISPGKTDCLALLSDNHYLNALSRYCQGIVNNVKIIVKDKGVNEVCYWHY